MTETMKRNGCVLFAAELRSSECTRFGVEGVHRLSRCIVGSIVRAGLHWAAATAAAGQMRSAARQCVRFQELFGSLRKCFDKRDSREDSYAHLSRSCCDFGFWHRSPRARHRQKVFGGSCRERVVRPRTNAFPSKVQSGTIAKGPPAPPSVTSRAKTTITNRNPRWEHQNGYHRCVDSLASLIIGACPTCVPLWPLEDGHCVDQ